MTAPASAAMLLGTRGRQETSGVTLVAPVRKLEGTIKIACWIDLALPHSGDWTEGMTPEDRKIYMKVYEKRLDWKKQEALNIREYLKD